MFADLSLSKTESGTDITALMGIPKALQTVNIAVAALLILMALLHVCLTGSLLGALEPLVRYGWILPVMVWAGSITNRQMPKLSKFIENNLLK